jgi:mannose-6-phosphate isomerase-like protein (cupin superfamily)
MMITENVIFDKAEDLLKQLGFNIVSQDKNKPWGGFYVIDESQTQEFSKHFFPEEDFESLKISEKLSPKLLLVAPGKRLSWQYHHRRAEIWKCIDGEVGVVTSMTDKEDKSQTLKKEEKIKLLFSATLKRQSTHR